MRLEIFSDFPRFRTLAKRRSRLRYHLLPNDRRIRSSDYPIGAPAKQSLCLDNADGPTLAAALLIDRRDPDNLE